MKRRFCVALCLLQGLPACSEGTELADQAGGAGATGAPEVVHCDAFDSVAQVEEHVILPKCGRAGDGSCHASGDVSPRLVEVGKMAESVLDVPGMLHCHFDKLVSSASPEQSYLLAKLRGVSSNASCSNGSNGGSRMPYQDAPQLTTGELACMRWWVHRIAE